MITTLILSRIPITLILSSDLHTQLSKTKRINKAYSLRFSKHLLLFAHCPRPHVLPYSNGLPKYSFPLDVQRSNHSPGKHTFLMLYSITIRKRRLQNGVMRNCSTGAPLHPLSLRYLLTSWKLYSGHHNTTFSLSGSLFQAPPTNFYPRLLNVLLNLPTSTSKEKFRQIVLGRWSPEI